ncbi:hypothetical protein GCM10022278_11910 [Allohahella marinimesophila]|uniref:Uncharacterized protein n=1 Tax=Allohahella marinimesophila TaxID=1054972 RepID=A0ABP7NVH5_9GAMM
MVRRGDIGTDAPRLAASNPQSFESLGRRDFVQQLSVDVDQRATIVTLGDDVAVPQFVIQGKSGHISGHNGLQT